MPYKMHWLIKNELIYIRYWGNISEDDLRQQYREGYKMIDGTDRHLVHIFTDVSQVEQSAPLQVVSRVTKEEQSHERVGWSITIGESNVFIRFVSAVARQLQGLRLRSVDTLEEAIDWLKVQDQMLNWDKMDRSVLEERAEQ